MRRTAAMSKTAAETVNVAADNFLRLNNTAGGELQTPSSVLNNTTGTSPNPLAALGKSKVTSNGGDDETYPGLEKPLVNQQELK